MTTFEQIDLEKLVFDRDNPRLPASMQGAHENAILDHLARQTALGNLMTSIGANDFFPGEAIVVTPDGPDRYVVVEGNRRLAALRLLQDPSLVNLPSLQRIAQAAQHKPTQIPAYIAETKRDTLQYLGFRHISGVQRWDPLAKARYADLLFKETANASDDPEERYQIVAREIGSNAPTVRRNLNALAAYRLIEQDDFFEIPELDESSFRFGTFYTAASNANIATFLGMRDQSSAHTHPILDPNVVIIEHLRELTEWLFQKDRSGNTKLIESRNISTLAEVVADPRCLDGLRRGLSLDAAYRLSPRGREDFIQHMTQALEELKLANSNIHSVSSTDQRAKEIVQEARDALQVSADRLGNM